MSQRVPREGRASAGRRSASPARNGTPAPPLPPALAESLPYLINWVSARLNLNLMGALRPLPITPGRWRALVVLTARDPSSITEIATDCGMDQSTASRVVDQLERDGLALRQVRPGDNRVTEVHLTPKGRRLHEFVLPSAREQGELMLSRLSAEERAEFLVLVGRIVAVLRG